MTRGIILSTGTIGLWIVLQLFFLHAFQTPRRFLLILRLYLVSLCLYILFQVVNLFPFSLLGGFDFLNGFLLHLLLFYAYLLIYYGVDRPITLRLLVEIYKAPGKTATMDAVLSQYDLKDVMEKRLKSLQDNGYIRQAGGRFFPTARGIFIANILEWGSRIYGKRKS